MLKQHKKRGGRGTLSVCSIYVGIRFEQNKNKKQEKQNVSLRKPVRNVLRERGREHPFFLIITINIMRAEPQTSATLLVQLHLIFVSLLRFRLLKTMSDSGPVRPCPSWWNWSG